MVTGLKLSPSTPVLTVLLPKYFHEVCFIARIPASSSDGRAVQFVCVFFRFGKRKRLEGKKKEQKSYLLKVIKNVEIIYRY